jgi:hypothetical protein
MTLDDLDIESMGKEREQSGSVYGERSRNSMRRQPGEEEKHGKGVGIVEGCSGVAPLSWRYQQQVLLLPLTFRRVMSLRTGLLALAFFFVLFFQLISRFLGPMRGAGTRQQGFKGECLCAWPWAG